MKEKVTIIGAGLGGLATALRLAKRGYQVEILEKNGNAGGRLNQLKKDGFTFDYGPSFFSMSYEFDELFKDVGVKNPLQLEQLDPLYSVYFGANKTPFHIRKQLDLLAKEFEKVEPELEQKLNKYLKEAGQLFHDTENIVVKNNFNSKIDYLLNLAKVPLKHAPKLFRNMWAELERHFESDEVKIILSLVGFFLGSTPFQTPAVYSLLNYTEMKHDGYWNVKGGMYTIVKEILKILDDLGVKIHYNTEIVKVNRANGGIQSFLDQNGKTWESDIFVSNSDAAAFRGKILGRKKFTENKLDKMEWSLAPFTIYMGVKGKIPQLNHHNYFLGTNFKDYADKIFSTDMIPEKPYYYVNVSSKSNPKCAPEGHENLFILCPVPDRRFKPDWSDEEAVADNIIKDLSERIGFDLKAHTVSRTIASPVEWEGKFNLYRGSGLGLSHGLKQIGGYRPRNKDEEFNNLYYVGASTTPGTGLPIVVIGSRLVTQRITQDYGIVSQS